MTKYTKQVGFRFEGKLYKAFIPKDLRLEAQATAKKLGMTFSDLVRYSLSIIIMKFKNK